MRTNEEKRENLITLCSFEELNYNQRSRLLSGSDGCTPDFSKCGDNLIKTLSHGVYNKVKESFYDGEYRNRIFGELQKRGIFCVTIADSDYPEELKKIPCPPITLFCKGRRELLKERAFAVVGSRRTGTAAYSLTRKIAADLTSAFAVVTGNADGADSAALEGALPSGKVICVLAHGLDAAYSLSTAPLVKEAEKRGLVIGEHFPTVAARSYFYPVRNRIIAGLAEGGLIASAGNKSGALITAEYLDEYSRKLFALPYQPNTPSGEGCNALIKHGAYLCENAADIFSVFGIEAGIPANELSADERALFEAIRAEGEAFLPAVAEKLGKLPFQLIPVISKLEIKGLVVRLGGNRYSVIK